VLKDKICPYCEKLYSSKGMGTHIWRAHGNGINFTANNDYSKRKIWNKDLSKATDCRVAANGKNIGLALFGKPGRRHSLESKSNLSVLAKKRGLGGVRKSRKITYKNILLGSSYELKLAIILDELNIKWELPTRLFYEDLNGIRHSYTSDFYLLDFNLFLDPKNDFLINNINPSLGFKDIDKIKWVREQNNVKILVLSIKQLNKNEILKLIYA